MIFKSIYTSNMDKKAFTIAEVLITIGILGIVMAMTLPNLIKDYRKKVTVEQLKKAYSVVSNALEMSQHENGDLKYWNVQNLGSTSDDYSIVITNFLNTYILPYMKIKYNCGTKCEAQKNVKRYALNGQERSWYDQFYYIIYLDDGSILSFMIDNDGKNWKWLHIYYDINGNKRPNIYGIDIFAFTLFGNDNHAIRFVGWDKTRAQMLSADHSEGCNVNASHQYAGEYCGALIMYDGWKISDDYPWK